MHDINSRSARFLFNLNIWWLKPDFTFRTGNWPGAPLVRGKKFVSGFAFLTATVFPCPGSDSVHVASTQKVSVRRLLRNACGPLWLVAEEFSGVDLFGEGDRDDFFDLFDVLVSCCSSNIRVERGECTTVLTWSSIVDAAGVADQGSDLSSVARETLWSFFGELPFAG